MVQILQGAQVRRSVRTAIGVTAAVTVMLTVGREERSPARVPPPARSLPGHAPGLPPYNGPVMQASDMLRAGDFNGDGYHDLVVGAAGRLAVLYGSPAGPDTTKRQIITPAGIGIPDRSGREKGWPAPPTSADFDYDGFSDLVVASRYGSAPLVIIYGGKGPGPPATQAFPCPAARRHT